MTSAHFWWTLRRIWEAPRRAKEISRPHYFVKDIFTVEDEWGRLPVRSYMTGMHGMFWKTDLRNLRRDWKGILLRRMPDGCTGKCGWRTDLCEWLEYQARRREEMECVE